MLPDIQRNRASEINAEASSTDIINGMLEAKSRNPYGHGALPISLTYKTSTDPAVRVRPGMDTVMRSHIPL